MPYLVFNVDRYRGETHMSLVESLEEAQATARRLHETLSKRLDALVARGSCGSSSDEEGDDDVCAVCVCIHEIQIIRRYISWEQEP